MIQDLGNISPFVRSTPSKVLRFFASVCYRFTLALIQSERVDDIQICPQYCSNKSYDSTEHSSLHWKDISVSTDSNVAMARAPYQFTVHNSFSSYETWFLFASKPSCVDILICIPIARNPDYNSVVFYLLNLGFLSNQNATRMYTRPHTTE